MTDARTGRERAETDRAAADRLAFFSDAVVAIAMTLLALELPVPSGQTTAELWQEVADNADDFLAFAISFGVIALHWRAHHGLFRYVMAAPPPVVWWNLLWLLTIVLTPFATRVLTEPGAFQARFIFYALLQVFTATFFLLSVVTLARRRVLDPQAPPGLVPGLLTGLAGASLAFLVSIPVALVFATPWVFLCWALNPVFDWLLGRLPLKIFHSGESSSGHPRSPGESP